jgi:single stranded DNA-binding protein
MAKVKIKVNQSIVSGYVPRDMFTNEKNTFGSFTVGYDKSYKSQDGTWVNQTAWIPVKIWAKEDRIKRLKERIKKGVSVIVTGTMDQVLYKDKDGKDVQDVYLRVGATDSIQVYDYGDDNSQSNASSYNDNNASYENIGENTGDLDFSFMNDASTY